MLRNIKKRMFIKMNLMKESETLEDYYSRKYYGDMKPVEFSPDDPVYILLKARGFLK